MTFTLKHHTALLSIDLQIEFVNGLFEVVGATEALLQAKQVLATARQMGLPIIHTQEVHRKEQVDFGRELDGAEPIHCLENGASTAFHPNFTPLAGEFVVIKRRYSGFFATDLDLLLRGLKIETLILMGALTNVCVHYTALDAHQHDYAFYVLEDCCIGSNWEAHAAALQAMSYLQRESRITSDDLIATLARV